MIEARGTQWFRAEIIKLQKQREDQYMGTIVVGAILLVIVGSVIFSMIRDKKSGKSLQCGCSCKNCSHHCGQ